MKSRGGATTPLVALDRRRGFNLLEVIMGAFLFSIIFGGLAVGWTMHERATRKYRDRNIALNFARNEIENLVAVGFTKLEEYATTVNGAPETTIERTLDGAVTRRTFRRHIAITTEEQGDLKEVVVQVFYVDDRDEERKVELETSVFYSAR